MQQIEQIVAELETGDLPLDKAIEKFEEGVKLSKFCSGKLDETEKKISILMKGPQGMPTEKPFFPEEGA